jgi:hypothetical protein
MAIVRCPDGPCSKCRDRGGFVDVPFTEMMSRTIKKIRAIPVITPQPRRRRLVLQQTRTA